jgi:protein Mpv17
VRESLAMVGFGGAIGDGRFPFGRGNAQGNERFGRRRVDGRRATRGSRTRANGGGSGLGSLAKTIEGKPLLKSALVCAALGCVGDTVAQRREASKRAADGRAAANKKKAAAAPADVGHSYERTLKQALYNFFFYGPVQHYWYIELAKRFPAKAFAFTAESLAPFGAKVFLNQAVLGPLVVTTFFLWGAVWSNDVANYPGKVKRDALPTLRAGWSFWVPASSVNFMFIPTKHQVLYMSACSIVWNVILSLNLNKSAPVAADGKKRK